MKKFTCKAEGCGKVCTTKRGLAKHTLFKHDVGGIQAAKVAEPEEVEEEPSLELVACQLSTLQDQLDVVLENLRMVQKSLRLIS